MTYEQYEFPLALPDASPRDPPESGAGVEDAIIGHAFAILASRHKRGEILDKPEVTKHFLRLRLADERNEVFGCIFLDTRHAVLAVEDLFLGTIDGASVYPRVIVQRALFHNAAALIAYHNHPSGVAEPSQADTRITQRIKDALALVDVRVLDHLVVCVDECASFAERGLL